MVHSSPLVRITIEAVAAAHLHVLGTSTLTNASSLQCEALRLLSSNLASIGNDPKDPSGEESLVATLLLIYYEVSEMSVFTYKLPS